MMLSHLSSNHKKLLTSDFGWLAMYVPDSTENKFGTLTIKDLPTPMPEAMVDKY